MSFNGRWGSFEIVVSSDVNRETELIGGIINALDRGSTLDKAKQSFINAGYKLEEIEAAIQKVPQVASRISKPLAPGTPQAAPAPTQTQGSPAVAPVPVSPQSSAPIVKPKGESASKGLVIALVIMGILVLAGAIVMIFFWDLFF